MLYKLQCPGFGPLPSTILLCGEKPGKEEIRLGKPFAGKSGDEQNDYLRRYHLSTRTFYVTNLIKHFIGDRNPTPDEINYWSPVLQSEIEQCNPTLIIAVGSVAIRYFLGEGATLETVHGLPHLPGAFDPLCSSRAPFNAIILPIYHPAFGFHDSNVRSLIAWDYAQVAECVQKVRSGQKIEVRYDPYEGKENYQDISGRELEDRLYSDFDFESNEFAIDTEGLLPNPFSFQVSWREGEGFMVRQSRKDFDRGLRAVGRFAKTRDRARDRDYTTLIGHNLMHDIPVMRGLGEELRRSPRLFDTMYASYITRIESYSDDPKGRSRGKQGLKPLAWRHNGTHMLSWEDVTHDIALRDRLAYLERVVEGKWPAPGFKSEQQHDGTWEIVKRQSVQKAAAGILRDWRAGKRNNKGELPDIEDRWHKVIDYVREPAERDLGPLPNGSIARLWDEDPDRAIKYAVGDSDQTLRLKRKLKKEIDARGLTSLMEKGMKCLPMIEEQQHNGFPASQSYFEDLSARMWDEMMRVAKRISKIYFKGRPFNPNSPPQTRELLAIRGLKAEKQTPGMEDSTAKGSIEHLRFTDSAIELLFDGREHEHILDKFCKPILRSLARDRGEDNDRDVSRVHCQLLNTRTATRRLAAKNPNLLNLPVRTELGTLVRKGFRALEGLILLSGDLSQIEYRILAHFSNDPTLVRLFRTGQDIHSQTAAWVFGVTLDEVKANKKRYRDPAKTVNYGKIYGQTGMGMADTLRKEGLIEWTPDRCDELIMEVDKLYPGVPKWIRQVEEETTRTEISYSHDGMPRHLPGIKSRDRAVRAEALRHAVSQRIQGTAQDMLQNSMIWLTPRIWKLQDAGEIVEPLLQVHDELIFMTDDGMVKPLSSLLSWALVNENGVEMRVPVEAEIHVGEFWSDLK